MKTRSLAIRWESLETRIQPATAAAIEYPLDFMGPLLPGGRIIDVQPMQLVTGISLSTTAPQLGSGFSATLSVSNIGPFTIVGTAWTYTISYGGFTNPPGTPNTGVTATSALFQATVPGTYTITAYTAYSSTNPPAPPPPPTTFKATATVAPPTTVTPTGGFGTPVSLGVTTSLTSTVSTAAGPLGFYHIGWVQERIPTFVDYNGVNHPFIPDWWPGGNTSSFNIFGSVLTDQVRPGGDLVGGVGVNWNSIPNGSTFATYDQELRYTWRMTVQSNGQVFDQEFSVDLNALPWRYVKVSQSTWKIEPN